ncbi:MAG: M14 family metallopeptidase [Zetaproteobacteria bacterium]|nr:M14 family metallopeptidase [Zetaproteobacteria bacterium]
MSNPFPRNYHHARASFLTAAHQAHARLSSYFHPLAGPEGETLATDVAWIGEEDAHWVLVLLSATHGVEGFSGSAAQVDCLQQPIQLPPGVAIVLIHAVNPHGFAWLRRVNEDGVDLNRNFIDFAQPLPINTGYHQLAESILPRSLDAVCLHHCDLQLQTFREKYGTTVYEQALSAGQFHHPHGLFYGGTAPTWSRQTCETIIHDFQLAKRKRLALIDFHTGIGPYGYGEPICDHPPGSLGVTLARQWYGEAVTEPALGTSISVAKHGLSDFGWINLIGDPLVFIALEFGTYPFDSMLQALRADHWLHAKGVIDWNAPETHAIKAAIRQHFYPDHDDWRARVLTRSRQSIQQALTGLANEARRSTRSITHFASLQYGE